MLGMRRLGGALVATAAVAALLAPAAGARTATAVYTVNGTAVTDATSTGVAIQVTGGSKNALRVLDLGDAFGVSANARTKWVVVNGLTPSQGAPADVDAGDKVSVQIRAPRAASAAALAAAPAIRVTDVTARSHPGGWPYLYDATVTGVDTGAKTLAVNVYDGNLNGLRSMLGAPVAETFIYADSTVFVKGSPRGPVLITAGALHAGDKIAIRTWAARWTPVATIAASPVSHVRLLKAAP